MKREEIISGLKFTIEMFLFDPITGEKLTEPRNDMDKITIEACKGAIELLEQEPKTGHWMKSNIGGAKVCSVCNAHMGLSSFKFCPNCGAKMDKENKDGKN